MMRTKKIVLPNDFSVRPMILLKKIMEAYPETNFDITLLHGIYPPDGITELLFFSKMRVVKELENEAFVKAYSLFKSKFKSRITAMHADIISSNRKHVLNTFLEVNEIEEVFLPEGIEFNFTGKDSYNLIPLLRKGNVPVKTITFKSGKEMLVQNDVSSLFLSDLRQTLIEPA